MAKLILKSLKNIKGTDIVCQLGMDSRDVTLLGYVTDWFVNGGYVHVRARHIVTGENIQYKLHTPDIHQAWVIVDDEQEG